MLEEWENLTWVIVLRCFTYYHVFSCLFLTKLTLSVCVWRRSCNSLHGSKCWCRWACGWL